MICEQLGTGWSHRNEQAGLNPIKLCLYTETTGIWQMAVHLTHRHSESLMNGI